MSPFLSFSVLSFLVISPFQLAQAGTCQVGVIDDEEVAQFPLAVGLCSFQEDTTEPEGDGSYSIECKNTQENGIIPIGTIYADITTCNEMETDDIETFELPGDCSNINNNCQLIEITRIGYIDSDCSGDTSDQIDTIIITDGANSVCIEFEESVYYSYVISGMSLTLKSHENDDCSDNGQILYDAFDGECVSEEDEGSNPAAFIHTFRVIDEGSISPTEEPTQPPNRL